jgi:preprotein translocase subunit SecE
MTKKKDTANEASEESRATAMTGKVEELREFFEESKVELKKVTWPTRKETLTTCGAVLILVVVMSVFLGVVDLGVSSLVKLILS